ncbi:STAS/SEC14 domain-containing protein [Microbulbifer variabilis]|uniref:STAS/SEC14 domain-containing protein n=1 Tax=Microbulbifer variabilis TaxID=266805 RepID=UPI001CFE5D1A|nr:STAS/SEC14 domain-containing protein [Microbulbifer variabilis]
MLTALDLGIANALAFRVSGSITESDVSEALEAARQLGKQYENITIYEEIESFEGFEFAAIIEKFKYLYDTGVSNISAAAILTDKRWLQKIIRVEDKIFRNMNIRCFSLDQREEAIQFLKHYAPENTD